MKTTTWLGLVLLCLLTLSACDDRKGKGYSLMCQTFGDCEESEDDGGWYGNGTEGGSGVGAPAPHRGGRSVDDHPDHDVGHY